MQSNRFDPVHLDEAAELFARMPSADLEQLSAPLRASIACGDAGPATRELVDEIDRELAQRKVKLPAFVLEKSAEAFLDTLLAPHANLIRCVQLQHADGGNVFVDRVALIPRWRRNSIGLTPIGIEAKWDYSRGFGAWVDALGQAREDVGRPILSRHLLEYRGTPLDWIFVFPDPRDIEGLKSDREGAYWGAERAAGEFGVGTIRYRTTWAGTPFLEFVRSGERLWSTLDGPHGPDALGTRKRRGSHR